MSEDTTCWAVFESQEGGMACSVYRDVGALLNFLKILLPIGVFGWVEAFQEENETIKQWCQTARVGDVFSYRNGYIVRCLTPWITGSGPKEAENAT